MRKRQEQKQGETDYKKNHECITATVGGDVHKECNAPKSGRRRSGQTGGELYYNAFVSLTSILLLFKEETGKRRILLTK